MALNMMAGRSVRNAEPTSDAFSWALKAVMTTPGETASAASFPGAAGGLAETLMPSDG